jgi:cysteine desulfurase
MMPRVKGVQLVLFNMIEIKDISYLDYNSTTPIDPRVLEAMLPFLKDNFANPSSTHHFGQSMNEKVKQAREQISDFINAESNELIFTSGATEAINMAIKGVAENYSNKGKHITIVSTEHKAVLDTCHDLERKGFEVTYLPVQSSGLIDLAELEKAIRLDTILVSIMYVNNETGVIQPIKEIASLAHESGALFMTDATQALGKIKIDVDALGVDLLCFSGHKMYAPKGVGALYVRQSGNKVKLTPQIHGGGHEHGLRSGTLNVPGIVALAKACEIAQSDMNQDSLRVTSLRNELENDLLQVEGAFVNGHRENRIYNTSNICFPNLDANVLIGKLKNIAVSNGSACTSAVMEPSHVLSAMGLSQDEAFGSLRFTLGRFNTQKDVILAAKLIKEYLNR